MKSISSLITINFELEVSSETSIFSSTNFCFSVSNKLTFSSYCLESSSNDTDELISLTRFA